MWMLASLFLAVQAALSRNFLFHVEPRKSKSGRTFTSFPQGILKGTWKGEITRRLPETTRETTNRRWSERLHWVDQVTLFCNNIENWTFRQSIFLESVFYLFFSSHAEDLDPEEGEGDVDSQLSGQQGGEQWWWWWTMMVIVDPWFQTNLLLSSEPLGRLAPHVGQLLVHAVQLASAKSL